MPRLTPEFLLELGGLPGTLGLRWRALPTVGRVRLPRDTADLRSFRTAARRQAAHERRRQTSPPRAGTNRLHGQIVEPPEIEVKERRVRRVGGRSRRHQYLGVARAKTREADGTTRGCVSPEPVALSSKDGGDSAGRRPFVRAGLRHQAIYMPIPERYCSNRVVVSATWVKSKGNRRETTI